MVDRFEPVERCDGGRGRVLTASRDEGNRVIAWMKGRRTMPGDGFDGGMSRGRRQRVGCERLATRLRGRFLQEGGGHEGGGRVYSRGREGKGTSVAKG